MAIEDIEAKILEDARLEAEKIISDAQASLAAELSEARSKHEAELTKLYSQIEQSAKLAREQFLQSLSLDKEKQILLRKRKWLVKIQNEVIAEIIASNELSTKYYLKTLNELKVLEKPSSIHISVKHQLIFETLVRQLNLGIPVVAHAEWEAGEVQFLFTKARIDASIKPSVIESLVKIEAKLENALFPHAREAVHNV